MSKDQDKAQAELDQKWDLCITDGIIKTGGGISLGLLAKILFFRGRSWPMIAGAGIGIGIAATRCEQSLNTATKGPPCVDPNTASASGKGGTYQPC